MSFCSAARRAAALAAALVLAAGAHAQAPADSIRAGSIQAGSARADTLALAAPRPATLRADSAVADSLPSPGRVLRRALLVPGWGQVTNGRPVRAGVAVAALVGAGVVLGVQQRETVRLRRVALVAGCEQVPGREPCADLDRARPAWEAAGRPPFPQAAAARDAARGRRDLAGLGVAVVYALQALDAYVGAHLLGFDVSDDLGVRVEPSARGAALAARVRF